MDRWTWMALSAFAPTAFALVVAFASMWVIAGWRSNAYLSGMAGPAKLVPLAALAFATVHGACVIYRIFRAGRGEGLLCNCGGLLGSERDGRYGPYRRCLACLRNVARRYYE